MKSDQERLHEELVQLADSPRGRELLQLALRGIARGDRDVGAGCWVRRGDAGCLFQHAYWEGVRAGIFADAGRPGDWIGNFVGSRDYGVVIRVIEAFDRLAKSTYSDIEPRVLLPDRVHLRQAEWNGAVEQMLLEVLGQYPGDGSVPRVPAPVAA
jgi:hypothetical protein